MLPTEVEKKVKTGLNPVSRTKQRLREQSVRREPPAPAGVRRGHASPQAAETPGRPRFPRNRRPGVTWAAHRTLQGGWPWTPTLAQPTVTRLGLRGEKRLQQKLQELFWERVCKCRRQRARRWTPSWEPLAGGGPRTPAGSGRRWEGLSWR